MPQAYPQIEVQGKSAVFHGEVHPSTRKDAEPGSSYVIWNLGEFSVNGSDPWRVTVTADAEKSGAARFAG